MAALRGIQHDREVHSGGPPSFEGEIMFKHLRLGARLSAGLSALTAIVFKAPPATAPATVPDPAHQAAIHSLKHSVNSLIHIMGDLLQETNVLIRAAIAGELDEGGWQLLVAGARVLDAVMLPLSEAVAVMGEMEKGKLAEFVHGDRKAQLEGFKNTVNDTTAKLARVIADVRSATEALPAVAAPGPAGAAPLPARQELAATAQAVSGKAEQLQRLMDTLQAGSARSVADAQQATVLALRRAQAARPDAAADASPHLPD